MHAVKSSLFPPYRSAMPMAADKGKAVRMPELLVFVRTFLLGVLLTELLNISYRGSLQFGRLLVERQQEALTWGTVGVSAACVATYLYRRRAHEHLRKILQSRRVDLLLFLALGYHVNLAVAPSFTDFDRAIDQLAWFWSPTMLLALLVFLGSAFLPWRGRRSLNSAELNFLSDVEIDEFEQDALGVARQAEQFADTVLASSAHAGLTFGVDGPWGIGKSSFLNLAEKRWKQQARDSVVVFKFQPLRYASDPDLSERFIRELCTALQQQVFAPEFLPAASRYSRMLKGKTDLSFLGFKLSLEPTNETIDELLEDIDDVLQRVGRRLIIIIDDLDRLETKLVNNVLFTVRRTFRLTRAAYILCYDTEMLVAGKEEGGRAREFLEKFITVKFSLFIEGRTIERFLRYDWNKEATRFQVIPAATMDRLSDVMKEAAMLLAGPNSKHYMQLLGDLRKVKRFVNSMVMMGLPDQDYSRGDIHYPDLIHLLLLHLYYPGLFRRIYVEESEGRVGSFSLQRGEDQATARLRNDESFKNTVASLEAPAGFLVRQLFDVKALDFTQYNQPDERAYRTRACFNTASRNLENYLALIVRHIVPAPVDTYRMYIDAVDAIIDRRRQIDEVLDMDDFSLNHGEIAHSQFWPILVNNSPRLDVESADQVISALVACIPRYSCHESGDYGLRQRSVSALAQLLDRVGFGTPRNGRVRDSTEAGEIGRRIFGEPEQFPVSIIDKLIAADRGPLGWNDLLIFRLRCSIDRGGNLHNLYSGLLRYEDPEAVVSGAVTLLATNSMRRLSQEVFKRFRKTYIDKKLNFYACVDEVSNGTIFGEAGVPENLTQHDLATVANVTRSIAKDFVTYQLTNGNNSNASGIGCGFYDESGPADTGGIKRVMTRYLLYFCFNPLVHSSNSLHFGDFCLRSLRTALFDSMGERRVEVAEAALTKLLPRSELKTYWSTFGPTIKRQLADVERSIVSVDFTTTYSESMPFFFGALDKIQTEPIL